MTKIKDLKYNRLSDALRQNLLKRKEQQRSRLKNKDESDLDTDTSKVESKNQAPSSKEQGEKE